MKRTKRHRIKSEALEPSSSHFREQEEHDLAYYIHDRVELMHQVFSAIKPKDLKVITPQCIRHLSLDNIKELCTEELLGISSKRLCAALDGAAPPSDTESSSRSSPDYLETISLDSISSDEEILSQASSKKNKKHKHRRRDSKSKSKKKRDKADDEDGEKSKASRAGLTVLELLELQARARAIRAQLQQEQAAKKSTEVVDDEHGDSSSDDEVLLKEEPPEVVEISSDEEKPSLDQLEKEMQKTSKEPEKTDDSSHAVTKRVNNLIITVPQTKPTRKIKLNRTKSVPVSNSSEKATTDATQTSVAVSVEAGNTKTIEKTTATTNETEVPKTAGKDSKAKEKPKKKKDKSEKKKKGKTVDKDGIDHDEIMLQLSDSEKLDLLEDLDRKNYDRVSSSSSEDSESSSEDSDAEKVINTDSQVAKTNNSSEADGNAETDVKKQAEVTLEVVAEVEINKVKENSQNNLESIEETSKEDASIEVEEPVVDLDVTAHNENGDTKIDDQKDVVDDAVVIEKTIVTECQQKEVTEMNTAEHTIQKESDSACPPSTSDSIVSKNISENSSEAEKCDKDVHCNVNEESEELNNLPTEPEKDKDTSDVNTAPPTHDKGKDMSEGELSDRDSSDVEATELKSEVVCISDEEVNSKSHKKKKHKKKDKKNKKEKKSKKSKSDFREGCDQNFYTENSKACDDSVSRDDNKKVPESIVIDDDDDVYEILELSDDSSCYEVEGTVLSKEPTAEEIEALSAKIDEIKREDVVTEEEIREHERREAEKNANSPEQDIEDNVELMSWKDRYISSKKVKQVLTTSNIFNALRKKNKELKKKLEESKLKEVELEEEKRKQAEIERLEKEEAAQKKIEGSVEFYNTLESSTKYVAPAQEVNKEDAQKETEKDEATITKEMKKDAKQLLKMYKRLLKYNDMDKKKVIDPNKKKKKKQKKKGKEDVSSNVANVAVTEGL